VIITISQIVGAQVSGAGDGPSWQVLGIVVGVLVVTGAAAIAIGVLKAQGISNDLGLSKLEARVKHLDDARVLDAFKAGEHSNRMAVLETNMGRTSGDIAASETRFRSELQTIKNELIGHIDRLAEDFRDHRREDTGSRRLSDMQAVDDASRSRPRGAKD